MTASEHSFIDTLAQFGGRLAIFLAIVGIPAAGLLVLFALPDPVVASWGLASIALGFANFRVGRKLVQHSIGSIWLLFPLVSSALIFLVMILLDR